MTAASLLLVHSVDADALSFIFINWYPKSTKNSKTFINQFFMTGLLHLLQIKTCHFGLTPSPDQYLRFCLQSFPHPPKPVYYISTYLN